MRFNPDHQDSYRDVVIIRLLNQVRDMSNTVVVKILTPFTFFLNLLDSLSGPIISLAHVSRRRCVCAWARAAGRVACTHLEARTLLPPLPSTLVSYLYLNQHFTRLITFRDRFYVWHVWSDYFYHNNKWIQLQPGWSGMYMHKEFENAGFGSMQTAGWVPANAEVKLVACC